MLLSIINPLSTQKLRRRSYKTSTIDLCVLVAEGERTTLLRNFIFWLSSKPRVTDAIARHGMRQGFARRFVAGETLAESMQAVFGLARAGRRIILNHLGENVATAEDARSARDSYIEMLEKINSRLLESTATSRSSPRNSASISIANFACLLQAISPLRRQNSNSTIEIDMEASAYTAATLDIFEAIQHQYLR